MSLTAITLQGLLLTSIAALPLIPVDATHGDVLVWSAMPPQTLASMSGSHWGGLSGPMGTYVMTGSVAALRGQDAIVLVDLDILMTLCGVIS